MLGRKLKCSFCGRNETQVGRLIAGPKVFICDTCIRVCSEILDASPESVHRNDASDAAMLAALVPALASVEATRKVLNAQVAALRERGVSWEAIGQALGVTRQAAWERFSRETPAAR
jgi:hypothetical protein